MRYDVNLHRYEIFLYIIWLSLSPRQGNMQVDKYIDNRDIFYIYSVDLIRPRATLKNMKHKKLKYIILLSMAC